MGDYPCTLNFNRGVLQAAVAIPGELLLYGFTVSSTNAGSQFILLFDATAVPGAGAIPLAFFPVSTNNSVSVFYGLPGKRHYAGVVLANSSTAGTLTAGAADCLFDVQYAEV